MASWYVFIYSVPEYLSSVSDSCLCSCYVAVFVSVYFICLKENPTLKIAVLILVIDCCACYYFCGGFMSAIVIIPRDFYTELITIFLRGF